MATAVGLVKQAAASWVAAPAGSGAKEKKAKRSYDGLRNLFRNFFE
jgi:hypothetical protein